MNTGVPDSLTALARQHDHFNMATVLTRLPEHIQIALDDTLPRCAGHDSRRSWSAGSAGRRCRAKC
jgi:hypothetical protein